CLMPCHSPLAPLVAYATLFRSCCLADTERSKTAFGAHHAQVCCNNRVRVQIVSCRTVRLRYRRYGCEQTHQGRSRLCCLVQSERSEEHTSELQSRENLVCRLLL